MLPALYRDTYDELRPVPMKSAPLKFDSEGRVAWGDIWGSFCDLAMAGGPPHRGTLLEPAQASAIETARPEYEAVVAELCRGLHLVTDLYARPSRMPGWIRLDCTSAAMASWLCRAILMENVSARADGLALGLPAGPGCRVEKEIKNVIVAAAKTCHYWMEHMTDEQHVAIGGLLRQMNEESPYLEPEWDAAPSVPERLDGDFALRLAEAIRLATGRSAFVHRSGKWVGVDCSSVVSAVNASRLLLVQNCAAHREDAIVFIPANHAFDPDFVHVMTALERALTGSLA